MKKLTILALLLAGCSAERPMFSKGEVVYCSVRQLYFTVDSLLPPPHHNKGQIMYSVHWANGIAYRMPQASIRRVVK